MQVFSDRAAQADIDAVYSMGLFDDISMSPQSAEDSTMENPKVGWLGHVSCCATELACLPARFTLIYGGHAIKAS